MTRARTWCRVCGDVDVEGLTAPAAFATRTVNQKVLPRAGSLSTSISPPISSMSRRQMTSPRPVPPKRRVVEPSAWLKGWKRRVHASGEIPIPVSRTSTRRTSVSARSSTSRADATTSPCSVNLTALPIRFVRI